MSSYFFSEVGMTFSSWNKYPSGNENNRKANFFDFKCSLLTKVKNLNFEALLNNAIYSPSTSMLCHVGDILGMLVTCSE